MGAGLDIGEGAMRQPRLKPHDRDTWHHCYNRVVGTHEDRSLSDADKEQFVRILRRVAEFYAVRIVAYQVMSNHFHLLLQAPAQPPSVEEAVRRFEVFHQGKRTLRADSPQCEVWRQRLRDVSWCMRHLQHLYTAWYNRTRSVRRRGPLWAGRFKNTVVEAGTALWACWAYIERNPARAGMVIDPGDYRFSSYGVWAQTGRHPFETAFRRYLKPSLPLPYAEATDEAIGVALRGEFARLSAEEAHLSPEKAERARTEAEKASSFSLRAQRRVRHWVDGLVIGSELFVRETLRRVRSEAEVARHRLSRVVPEESEAPPIYCWRRLRAVQD